MDYATISRNDIDDDEEEECVIVKTISCENDNNYDPLTATTFDVVNEDAFCKYGYDNFISALIKNQNVQTIENLPVNLASYFGSVRMNGITSLDRLTVPLVEFLRTSKSLRQIKLQGTVFRSFLRGHATQYDNNGAYLLPITKAVTCNKGIEHIELQTVCRLIPQIIAGFVSAPGVKSFSVRIWDFSEAAGSIDILLHAFRTNRTLETLSLFHFGGAEADNVALVLLALSGHPKIRVLKLQAVFGTLQHSSLMAALASFVGGAPSLEHLWLKRYSFVLEDLTLLLDNLSAAKLTITNSKLDDPSITKLASYVQASPSLKELALAPHFPRCNTMFPHYKDMLIGSSLQVLDLSGFNCSVNVRELFRALGASTDNICRLPCLHLGELGPTHWNALSFHLPSQIYLRELRVDSVPTGVEATYFIAKMRQNGSLHRLFLTCDTESDHRLDESQIQVLKSVCTRNRIMRDTLLTQFNERSNDYNPLSSHEERSRRRSLIPSLLYSASTIPRTGPNMILMSLLSGNVSVGSGMVGSESEQQARDRLYEQ